MVTDTSHAKLKEERTSNISNGTPRWTKLYPLAISIPFWGCQLSWRVNISSPESQFPDDFGLWLYSPTVAAALLLLIGNLVPWANHTVTRRLYIGVSVILAALASLFSYTPWS